ncbi:MAG: FAD-dependent oxidoreductase [Ignavibacteria bacterium]|nr:FAD-dependent oxidoreductase [Ignavibacteria bacterium]MBI3766334.1 FAD-dependent oxidoreductase [Ignavibacteriales bacterium]
MSKHSVPPPPRSAVSKSFVDVAIIGGGLSGLAAAADLASRGASVALFERSARLGGRCYSYVDKRTGDIVDNGQHVLLGAYHHLFRYLKMIGTSHLLNNEPTLRLPLHHPSEGFAHFQISSLPKPFDLTAGMLKFKLLTLRDRQKLLRVGLALKQWNEKVEQELQSLTIEQWLARLHQSEQARVCFWYPIAISVMNETPQRACALLFARTLRAAFLGKKSDSAILIPTVGQSELYVSNAEELFARKNVSLHLNTEVESLEVSNARVMGVRAMNGTLVRARNVVSAVPYFALAKLIPAGASDEKPFSDLPHFESSPIISMNLWFDREIMDVGYVGLISKTLQWVFNRRRILRQSTASTGYLSAVISGAREYADVPKEKLITLALRDLHAVFPESRKAKLVHAVVIKEKRATFSPTCEVEPLRPSAETPIQNFFLAGDWTNTGFPATIEGAVMSGFNAAKLIR